MSDRCGNRFELPDVNVVRFGDVEAMAHAMMDIEARMEKGRGKKGGSNEEGIREDEDVLHRYDCREWAERTLAFSRELIGEGGAK